MFCHPSSPKKALSAEPACIRCSVSMKWHCQSHLLTIQQYLQKYWDDTDDQRSLMFKSKLLPAVWSHLALVKFYCAQVPVQHCLMGSRDRGGVLVGQRDAQPACSSLSCSSSWRSRLGNTQKWVRNVIRHIPFNTCSQVGSLNECHAFLGANTRTTQSTQDSGKPRFYVRSRI